MHPTIQRHAETANVVYQLARDEYAPNYYKYPDALALLLKTTATIELELNRFNKAQVAGIEQRLNLAAASALKLDQFDDLGIFIDFAWDQDEDILGGIFAGLMPSALSAGALMSQEELGFAIDFNPADLPAQKFLERHVPKLAGGVTDVTKERVKNSIRQSLLAGKNRDEMVHALEGIIDHPARRRAIAQTESVIAFSEGRIQAGIEMGATHKKWRAQLRPCPICSTLHGLSVKLTASFPGGYYAPAAHTNCRCGLELVFDQTSQSDPEAIAARRKAYIDGLKTRI